MLPTHLDAVLFDAGGTLVHLDYGFIARAARAWGYALSETALRGAEVAARRMIDAHAQAAGSVDGSDDTRRPGYFETLLRASGVSEPGLGPILGELEREHRKSVLWRVPVRGAEQTLLGLRARGLRTAVVSNSDGRVARCLAEAGLAEHLELVVDSHHEGVEKPDPEIFHRALDRLGVRPERAAYVGDIYSIDAVGARAAGMAAVILDPTGCYELGDCPRLAGLPDLLDRIAPAGRGGE